MTKNPPKAALDKVLGYRALLGDESWARLHPAIQQRFSNEHYHRPVNYIGTMKEVYLSFAGKFLAHLCRLIGTPLALYSGQGVPTVVRVYRNTKLNGMTWDRFYYYPDKPVNRVRSTKCIKEGVGLIELVGFGFGMQLALYENEGALYFESTEFFFRLGGVRIPIPDILSPGKTIVVQKALDDARFQFSLNVNHPILGQLFHQVGVFQEELESELKNS